MILGTAGHIDHGKTTLVRALTGVDTDRLPEEKRRGITIELGFAPLELDGVGTIGVVDVPGHEAFVRTMVAGATGIDLALLVVAADEGVMPQTREHLAILALLGVRARRRRAHQVRSRRRRLARARRRGRARAPRRHAARRRADRRRRRRRPGQGIDELRAALAAAARAVPARARGRPVSHARRSRVHRAGHRHRRHRHRLERAPDARRDRARSPRRSTRCACAAFSRTAQVAGR